ncbi:MAG: endonuclease/exonuclease/phosphatase family protein [Patescibacteria group bacterium]
MADENRLNIISLNTWAGMAGSELLLSFFETYRDADIFCLQEVQNGGIEDSRRVAAGRSLKGIEVELLEKLKATLPDHVVIFTPQYARYYGVAMFIRKGLRIVSQGDFCVYREPGFVSTVDIADHARVLQHATIEMPQGLVTVLNVHAAWQATGKVDTPERLEQSQRIIDFTKTISHPLVLCGDFNLLPETQSIKLLEDAGWENLITTHGITSTRTSLYKKPERYADYIFTKNGVNVHEFRTLPEEVSDHAALFLDCSI